MISFELPGLPKSLNGSHGHWAVAASERKRWRKWSALAAAAAKNRAGITGPLGKVKAIFTRFSTRRMDYDNLVASFKGVVDGLRDAGIIADDTDEFIVDREYRWERAERGKCKISVEVLPVKQTRGVLYRGSHRVSGVGNGTGAASSKKPVKGRIESQT